MAVVHVTLDPTAISTWGPFAGRMMAHPICPWPFGTVIRPTQEPDAPWNLASRHMVIGPLPSDPTRSTLMLDLINGTSVAHLNDGITERWVGIIETETSASFSTDS